ncbi:hypothetical protein ACOI1H_20040 [Loktanella sp. DJP18]|uniref:hypothetical protein n=1 Tax=Loktanella sp. DJP18 TaxID=3409788 RepID=UPI003BB66277
MDYMERFKLRLQLAINNTKTVRLAQTKDHLVWRRFVHDDGGQRHEGNSFVFMLATGKIVEIFISDTLTQNPYFSDSEDVFLDEVAGYYTESESS